MICKSSTVGPTLFGDGGRVQRPAGQRVGDRVGDRDGDIKVPTRSGIALTLFVPSRDSTPAGALYLPAHMPARNRDEPRTLWTFPCGRVLPTTIRKAEALAEEGQHMILKAIGNGAGMRARVDCEAVGNAVVIEKFVQPGGVYAQTILIADVHRTGPILLERWHGVRFVQMRHWERGP